MNWVGPLAPLLTPLLSTLGMLGVGWLVYRQTNRATDATSRTTESATHVEAMRVLSEGFKQLYEEQRTSYEQVTGRVSALEQKVAHLEEEQRQDRRWKVVAVGYIRTLLHLVRSLGHTPPPAPEEIAPALTSTPDGGDQAGGSQ